jgi:hypothetical protein
VEEIISVHMILVRKPEGKGPLGRHRCRWEDIRKELEDEWCGLDSTWSGYGLVVECCEHRNIQVL